MPFKDFQHGLHGDHLEYWNKTILAVLNLHVAPMPPDKFQLKMTKWLTGDVVEEFQHGRYGPCDPNASNQVWA